ncbi:MAG: hypothetical protein AAGJ46_17740 [Planctomycetota bacterium]
MDADTLTQSTSWSARECQILEALSLKVRCLTTEQLSAGWFGHLRPEHVIERMEPLTLTGLAERRQVYAHPLIAIRPPVFSWKPGDESPSDSQIHELAEVFQSRWSDEEVLFDVFVATPEGASLFGSYITEAPANEQWTHDIHVAEIYVDLMADNSPEDMQRVVGEGALPKLGLQIRHKKDPDLFVFDEHRRAMNVVEFAGAYDYEHVKQLHEHCSGGGYSKLHKHFRGSRKHLLYPSPNGTPYVLV